jgi:hypothetical protein
VQRVMYVVQSQTHPPLTNHHLGCDSAAGHEELQSCVESCQRPIAVAEETLSNELQNFQRGLALCANSCQESVNAELNKASAGGKQQPDKVTMDRLQLKVDTCTNRCIEDCLTNLPPLQKRVDTSLSRLGGA